MEENNEIEVIEDQGSQEEPVAAPDDAIVLTEIYIQYPGEQKLVKKRIGVVDWLIQ